nr:MAG TPA: RecT protein [Caudoviricetes sp.]
MSENTQVAEVQKRELIAKDFTEGLVVKVQEKEKFGLTFPKDYNYTNEFMSAMLILQDTKDSNKKPVLQSCTRASIENALLEMVTAGLSMQKGQCYPIAYGGKLSCQRSVYGNTCLARNYGMKEINAMCIYDGDVFEYHIENAKIVIDTHKQNFANIDNDKIIGAYAVATMNDGTQYTEVMNMSQIKQAWKQGFNYRENGGTHQKFTDQMAMKTVKNRLLKYIIRTYRSFGINDDFEEDIPSHSEIIETDVAYDIAENANTEDFIDGDVVESDTPETEETPTAEPEQVEMPDFMQ